MTMRLTGTALALALISHLRSGNGRLPVVSAFSLTHQIIAPSPLDDSATRQTPRPPFRKNNAHRRQHPGKTELNSAPESQNGDIGLLDARDPNVASSYFDHLLSQFQGDFDNYNQVVRDRRRGLPPGDGGGHEHMHCSLVPCPRYPVGEERTQWVLVAFYLNGNPHQIFRFRAYQLLPPPSDETPAVRMRMHMLSPELEQRLRRRSEQPCTWWKEVWNVWQKQDEETKSDGVLDAEEWNDLRATGVSTIVSPIEGCDVLWDPEWDPSEHSYLYVDEYNTSSASTTEPVLPPGRSCHAIMEAGPKGATVDSVSMIPGKRILIKGEFSLWGDEFWSNDRAYHSNEKDDNDSSETDCEGMSFLYGNRRGVPYKLQRVSDFVGGDDAGKQEHPSPGMILERIISNADLKWTLGDDFRTSDLYEEKMQVVDEAIR